MKHLKKIASFLLAMVMVLGMTATTFAASAYSITVENNNTAISIVGNTYKAYKLFDVTYNDGKTAYNYTVADEFKNFEYTVGTTTYKGDTLVAYIATLKDNAEALDTFAEAALKYATDNSITAAGEVTATDEKAVIDLKEPGYYLVAGQAKTVSTPAETITAACSLTTAAPTATVKVKADVPEVDKKIDGKNDTDPATQEMVKYNNTSIGDKVPYVVTSKVPDMTGYEKYYFVVNDTLSKGLTFNDDVAITIGDKTLAKDTDYTVTSTVNADGTTSVEIVFKNFINYKAQKGAAITVTYSATVNEDAVIGIAGNPNKVTLIYSNNPNTKDDGTPGNPDKPTPNSPVGETPESETRTYVTEIELIKVDDKGNRLTGAEFQIEGTRLNKVIVTKDVFTAAADGTYYKLKDGTYTTTAPTIAEDETDNSDKYESTTTKYTKTTTTETITTSETVKAKATVGADGTLKFTGLAAGDYTITEIKAPDGYNLLKAPVNLTIGWTAPTAPSTDCTWTYSWDIKDGDKVISSGNTAQITVVNKTGTELPSTGGMGTTLFYVLGAVLMMGAAVLLITKRRMNTR